MREGIENKYVEAQGQRVRAHAHTYTERHVARETHSKRKIHTEREG